jgi:hypothetical protein
LTEFHIPTVGALIEGGLLLHPSIDRTIDPNNREGFDENGYDQWDDRCGGERDSQ